MSNFGVTYLLKVNKNNKRLSIEDNIGEEIHIHFGEMRLMLKNEEFREFAAHSLDYISDVTGIPCDVLDKLEPIFLFDLCRRGELPSLTLQNVEYVSVGDLLCPGKSVFGDWQYRPIKYSHFLKVLQGKSDKTPFDKDQINYLGKTNNIRCEEILKACRDNKDICEEYPLYVTGDNVIRDGQHRAAALYFLYGHDFRVKIQRMETDKKIPAPKPFHRRITGVIKWTIKMLLKQFRIIISRQQSEKKKIKLENYLNCTDQEPNMASFDELRKDQELNREVFFANPDFALSKFPVLIRKSGSDPRRIKELILRQNLQVKEGHRLENITFIYGLGEDYLIVDEADRPVAFLQNKLSSYAMSVDSFMPYDPEIQKYLNSSSDIPEPILYVLRLLKCMFDKKQKGFLDSDIEYFDDHNYVLKDPFFQKNGMIEKVLFGYSDRMVELLRQRKYESIIDDYRKFEY